MLNISLPRSSMFSTLQPLGDTLVALILHAPRSQLSMSRTLLAALTGEPLAHDMQQHLASCVHYLSCWSPVQTFFSCIV
jgi:biotin transporter BioY